MEAKPVTHLVILFPDYGEFDRRDRRIKTQISAMTNSPIALIDATNSLSPYRAHLATFANRRDRRIKSLCVADSIGVRRLPGSRMSNLLSVFVHGVLKALKEIVPKDFLLIFALIIVWIAKIEAFSKDAICRSVSKYCSIRKLSAS